MEGGGSVVDNARLAAKLHAARIAHKTGSQSTPTQLRLLVRDKISHSAPECN
jgi:hypothetical protein